MSRYIDTDALIAKWEEDIKHITNASFRAMMQGAINEVSNAPIADVVEVVRCEDCMWNYIHVTPKGHDYHICRLMNLAFDNNDNFFCAYGEKKNKDAEPIPQWRGCMDGCLPFSDGGE